MVFKFITVIAGEEAVRLSGLMTMGVDLGLLLGKMNTSSTVGASEYAAIVNMNLFVALLCACIVIGHLLEENRWMNESITALIIVSHSLIMLREWLKDKFEFNLYLFLDENDRVYAQVL